MDDARAEQAGMANEQGCESDDAPPEVGAQRVAVMLPELAWLREAFGTAGFGYGDWKGELWVFERWLSARGDHES